MGEVFGLVVPWLLSAGFGSVVSFFLFYRYRKAKEKLNVEKLLREVKRIDISTDQEQFDSSVKISASFSEIIEKLTRELADVKIRSVEARVNTELLKSELQASIRKNQIYEKKIRSLLDQLNSKSHVVP